MKISSLKFIILISLTAVVIMIFVPLYQIPHNPEIKLLETHGLELKWERKGVFSSSMDQGPFMRAVNGNLYISGSGAMISANNCIFVLDGSNGSVIATTPRTDIGSFFTFDHSSIYYTRYGSLFESIRDETRYLILEKFDLQTKKSIWKQGFGDSRNLAEWMEIVDGELYVKRLSDSYLFSTADGAILQHEETSPYYNKKGVAYEVWDDLIANKNGKEVWRAKFPAHMYGYPIFHRDSIYLRVGTELYIIDQKSGKILWRSENYNIISNIAVSSDRIYFVTQSGNLYSIGIKDKDIKTQANFNEDGFFDAEHGNSAPEVAYDEMTKMIYVLLSDSGQLFAFQETE